MKLNDEQLEMINKLETLTEYSAMTTNETKFLDSLDAFALLDRLYYIFEYDINDMLEEMLKKQDV